MTTVVFDGVMLACDSRRSDDETVDPFDMRPKIRVIRGAVFVGCGYERWVEAFPTWYFEQTSDYPLESSRQDDVSEIAVYANGKWRKFFSDSTFPETMPAKWALGSGELAGLVALMCKRNAVQAVLVATKIDKDSGGPIFGAQLADLVNEGEKALVEYQSNGKRKSARTSNAVLPRKGRTDNRAVRKRRDGDSGLRY